MTKPRATRRGVCVLKEFLSCGLGVVAQPPLQLDSTGGQECSKKGARQTVGLETERQTEWTSLALKVLARPHSYTFLGPTLYILCQTPFFVAREDHTLKTKLINTLAKSLAGLLLKSKIQQTRSWGVGRKCHVDSVSKNNDVVFSWAGVI